MNYNKHWVNPSADMTDDIKNAQENVAERNKTALLDKTRPKYHFASPAGNLIDTWGGIFHKGYCHVFYDINADNASHRYGGYFGHIRSKDLVNWEQLPLALAPSEEKDELQLNDGYIAIDKNGKPILWYTSVFNGNSKPREHTPVRGDDDLIKWERIETASPITLDNHGGPQFHWGWSDPVIFTEQGRTFMIISKCVTIDGDKNMIPIYEAKDDELLEWEYKGVFLDDTGEVINFIKIDDKWVLIHSPYNNPVWLIGRFDIDTFRFIPETNGMLSYGYINQGILTDVSRGFYATTVAVNPNGENIIFGWVSGFDSPAPALWEGAIGIPRILSIDKNNKLLMNPVKELEALRIDSIPLECGREITVSNAFEMVFDTKDFAQNDEIEITIGSNIIKLNKDKFILRDITVDASSYGIPKHIHLYIDVTMSELFINNGICSITRCIDALDDNTTVNVSYKGQGRIENGFIYNLCTVADE